MYSIDKKPSKFDEKTRKKIGSLINKKSLKLNQEIRKKTDYSLLYRR